MNSMPAYQPIKIGDLAKDSIYWDKAAYTLSDQDFAKRHPGLLQGEKLFEQSALNDQKGDNTLMPQIQGEFQRAGLAGALSAFGDTGATLKAGSAGEASVARNLGQSIMGFQDRNRTNRMQSLGLAESLFPRRTFGITGKDAAMIDLTNNAGQNNWNQANYAQGVQQDQFNQNLAAQKKAEQMQLIMGIVQGIGSIAGAAAGACHVAREVLGTDSDEWELFRAWMLSDAPDWFRQLYLENAESVAKWLRPHKLLKAIIRPWFKWIALRQRIRYEKIVRSYH